MTTTHTNEIDLDETDRQVLAARLRNGRADLREIAAATGLAANRVDDSLTRLEAAGVIDGYRALVDYDRLGYDVTALLWLTVSGEEVLGRLQRTPGIVTVYEVTGDHDVLAVGKFRDDAAMSATVADLLTDDGVETLRTSLALDAVREFEPLDPTDDG